MINNDASSFLMFRSMWMFILPVSWHLHAIHSVNKGTILQESKMYILRYLVIAYYQELYIEIINFLQACVIFWITIESLYKCAISSYSHFLTFFKKSFLLFSPYHNYIEATPWPFSCKLNVHILCVREFNAKTRQHHVILLRLRPWKNCLLWNEGFLFLNVRWHVLTRKLWFLRALLLKSLMIRIFRYSYTILNQDEASLSNVCWGFIYVVFRSDQNTIQLQYVA